MSRRRSSEIPLPRAMSRAAMVAGAVAFKYSRRIREEPYRWFRLAQRIDPLHQSALGVWVAMSHAAVSTALRHPNIGRLPVASTAVVRSALLRRIFKQASPEVKNESAFYNLFTDTRVFSDPVLQPRLKTFLSRTFTPRRLAELRPMIEAFIEPVLDEAAKRGRIEVVTELGQRLPGRVICMLMGVPQSDEHILLENAPRLVDGFEASPMRNPEDLERADQAAIVLRDYITSLVAERRRSSNGGGDDLISSLVGLGKDEGPESDDELVGIILALWFAGQASTAAVIGSGVLALLRNPGQLARWHEDPSIEHTAVEELLRYDPPAMLSFRDVLEDAEIEGRRIPKGSMVVMVLGAANHDPRVFEDPWRLDLTRDPNPHLAFGAGAHYCMGAPLARLEAGIFFTSFARRFPNARLAPGGVVRRKGVIRVLRKLEILVR